MIVNDSLVSLTAWHVKGDFVQGTGTVPIEWYILDDPANPLTLRFAIGKDKMEIIRMSFPLGQSNEVSGELPGARPSRRDLRHLFRLQQCDHQAPVGDRPANNRRGHAEKIQTGRSPSKVIPTISAAMLRIRTCPRAAQRQFERR